MVSRENAVKLIGPASVVIVAVYVLGQKVGSLAATETVSVKSANPGVG